MGQTACYITRLDDTITLSLFWDAKFNQTEDQLNSMNGELKIKTINSNDELKIKAAEHLLTATEEQNKIC